MGYYKRTFDGLKEKGYFLETANTHKQRFFLTKQGQKLFIEATTPEEKTDLYYSFLKTYRNEPEQDPLNRLVAFVAGNTILGISTFSFGSWPSCFNPSNSLLSALFSKDPNLSELLGSLSEEKACPFGLEDTCQLLSSLEKPNSDGSYSPLSKAQRELVFGWIQCASEGVDLK